jgi:hypothetical protein
MSAPPAFDPARGHRVHQGLPAIRTTAARAARAHPPSVYTSGARAAGIAWCVRLAARSRATATKVACRRWRLVTRDMLHRGGAARFADELGKARGFEERGEDRMKNTWRADPSGACLLGLMLRADHHAVAVGGTNVVAHGGGEIKRRNSVGGADLDTSASIGGPAELVAELHPGRKEVRFRADEVCSPGSFMKANRLTSEHALNLRWPS